MAVKSEHFMSDSWRRRVGYKLQNVPPKKSPDMNMGSSMFNSGSALNNERQRKQIHSRNTLILKRGTSLNASRVESTVHVRHDAKMKSLKLINHAPTKAG